MKTNTIGLSASESAHIVERLNGLLASFQVYYQNLRGLHWNIRGRRFFELHLKFEELYNDAQLKIDEVAERILTLGGVPLHTFSDYMAQAKLPVGKNIHEDHQAVSLVIDSLLALLPLERDILRISGESGDEGTNSMMGDFIKEQEKTVWMMKAWLGDDL